VKEGTVADKLFAETFVPVGGKRKCTVLLSMLAHTAAVAAAIMIPLVASDALVLPARLMAMPIYVSPQLPSPPPLRTVTRDVRPVPVISIPLIAPQGITAEKPIETAVDDSATIRTNAGFVPGGELSGLLPTPPPPSVTAQVPVRPGTGIRRPTKIRDAVPEYPEIARVSRVEGMVIVEATIAPDGKVQDARILRSIPLLNAAALDAVRRWEYTPTLLNGIPVALVMTVTVDFRLR
jgi:protein TonB